MNLTSVEATTKKFSRQVAAYEAAGLQPDMEIQLPFAANVDQFFNVAALVEHGIDPMGLARQVDQILVENIGNNFSQRVKSAVNKQLPLPDQSTVDEMLAAYDFTGIRATSEEGMSTEERTIIAEIKKALRSLISGGAFAMLGVDGNKTRDPNSVAFNAVRVQTGPESRGEKQTPAGSVPLDNFDQLVAAAYQATEIDFEDGNGNVAVTDFSIEPVLNEDGLAMNLTGVIELARQEAVHILERNRAKAVPTVSTSMTMGQTDETD